MADAHFAPAVSHVRDVVEATAHIAHTHVRVDADDVAATRPASAVVRTRVGVVPRPVAREELGRDVPGLHLGSATPVAGDAVDPGSTAREIHAVLRRSVECVAERAAVRRTRGCRDEHGQRGQSDHSCHDGESQKLPRLPGLLHDNHPFRG